MTGTSRTTDRHADDNVTISIRVRKEIAEAASARAEQLGISRMGYLRNLLLNDLQIRVDGVPKLRVRAAAE